MVAPEEQTNLQKLEIVRDTMANVYESEVCDDVFDNGKLTQMNEIIIRVEKLIKELKERDKEGG